MKKRPAPNFEADLAELEQLVARMERGDLSLEDAIGTFERGVALAKACQQALREAEQKVQQLSQGAGGETLVVREAWTERGYLDDALISGARFVGRGTLAEMARESHVFVTY